MFIQSLVKSKAREVDPEDEVELLSKQDREDYNVMPHFKNRVSLYLDSLDLDFVI